jgi:hypothetical protein
VRMRLAMKTRAHDASLPPLLSRRAPRVASRRPNWSTGWELDFEIPWDNTLLGTGSAHEQRAIGGYSFTFHRGTPPKDTSSAAGAIIGLPPLFVCRARTRGTASGVVAEWSRRRTPRGRHHHHTTFVFGGGGSATASNGMGGTQALSLLGQSDAQCSGEAAGFSCLNVDLAQSGYALLTTSAAMAGSRVGAHVNDVRPAGSPAFVWYYNVRGHNMRAPSANGELTTTHRSQHIPLPCVCCA